MTEARLLVGRKRDRELLAWIMCIFDPKIDPQTTLTPRKLIKQMGGSISQTSTH